MTNLQLYLVYSCGVHSIVLAVFHCFFWKLFHWKKQLTTLSPLNRAIMQILNLRLIFVFFALGAGCFLFPEKLSTTSPGRFVLAAAGVFWVGRVIEQYIFIRQRNSYNYLATFVFMAGAVLFLAAAW